MLLVFLLIYYEYIKDNKPIFYLLQSILFFTYMRIRIL
nr:ALPV-324 [Albatrosspox virus]